MAVVEKKTPELLKNIPKNLRKNSIRTTLLLKSSNITILILRLSKYKPKENEVNEIYEQHKSNIN